MTQAQKTNHKNGRTNDDLQSFVQSLVLSTSPCTHQQLEDKVNGSFVRSYKQIAETVGVSTDKYHRIRKRNQAKRDSSELQSERNGVVPTGTIFSQVVKSKGWRRVPVLRVAIRNDFFRIIPTKNTHRAL